MDVLIIGGTRFVGYGLVWRLLARGDRVTLLNRGTLPDPFGDRVERIHVDRHDAAFASVLTTRSFDAAVDFAAFTGDDARGAVAALGGRVGQYVFISSGQVYLVVASGDPPFRESAYDAPLLPRPEDPYEDDQWSYGVGKREAEDVLQEASTRDGFPATRLRIPMVDGERDASQRMTAYLWRLLDGGPILLPDGGFNVARHIYASDVVSAVIRILGDSATFGQAYNLAQEETPRLRDLVALLASELGASRHRLVDVSTTQLRAAGLDPRDISPFSSRWMSNIDPARARAELDFTTTPMSIYIGRIVASFLAHPPAAPQRGYERRALELALVRQQ
jgi:nucleoside-diphosphate-sugar epimerase